LRRSPILRRQRHPRSGSECLNAGSVELERAIERARRLVEPAQASERLRKADRSRQRLRAPRERFAETSFRRHEIPVRQREIARSQQCRGGLRPSQRCGGTRCTGSGSLARCPLDASEFDLQCFSGKRHRCRGPKRAFEDVARIVEASASAQLPRDAEESTGMVWYRRQYVVVDGACGAFVATALRGECSLERGIEGHEHSDSLRSTHLQPPRATADGRRRPRSVAGQAISPRAPVRADRARIPPAPARSTRRGAGDLVDRRCMCPPSGPSCSCRAPHRAPSGK